jgi:tetratricopeptide (TPR) repeat protein
MDGLPAEETSVDLVRYFLKGQNLEQLGRVDEALDLYEHCLAGGFDSSGPYDRLIALYANLARHADVVRVAEAALANVQTHEEKRAFFERMRSEAANAGQRVPKAIPKKHR